MRPLTTWSLRRAALAAAVWGVAGVIGAQSPDPRRPPVDAGAIVNPPAVDRKAVKPAPRNVDPDIAVPAGQRERGSADVQPRKRTDADCKGPPELCKQSKPK